MDKIGEILKIDELLVRGIITQDEFNSMKEQIITFNDEHCGSEVITPYALKKESILRTIKNHLDIELDSKTISKYLKINFLLSVVIGLVFLGSLNSFILLFGSGIGITAALNRANTI